MYKISKQVSALQVKAHNAYIQMYANCNNATEQAYFTAEDAFTDALEADIAIQFPELTKAKRKQMFKEICFSIEDLVV